MEQLKIVWISDKQQDNNYSAIAVRQTEPMPHIIQEDRAFVRGDKVFKLGDTVDVPDDMIANREVTQRGSHDWKFSKA